MNTVIDSDAVIHLSERGVARFRNKWVDDRLIPVGQKDRTSFATDRVDYDALWVNGAIVLSNGWVRTHFTYEPDSQTVVRVDLLLPPSEVLAIETKITSRPGRPESGEYEKTESAMAAAKRSWELAAKDQPSAE